MSGVSVCGSAARAARGGPSGTEALGSDIGFVDVTPAPVFARLERLHDRVPDRVRMGARMPERRGVAAADVPAGQAQPQVHPGASRFPGTPDSLRASAASPGAPGSGAGRTWAPPA